jgi:NTP-dependent ternary system trypsin peptidase co-occuring protein
MTRILGLALLAIGTLAVTTGPSVAKKDKIGIAEVIKQVKNELIEASIAPGDSENPALLCLSEAELRFQVEFSGTVGAEGGIVAYVVNFGVDGEATRTTGNEIILKFESLADCASLRSKFPVVKTDGTPLPYGVVGINPSWTFQPIKDFQNLFVVPPTSGMYFSEENLQNLSPTDIERLNDLLSISGAVPSVAAE